MRAPGFVLALLSTGFFTVTAAAQTPFVLVRPGQPIPGIPGATVQAITERPSTNTIGGWVVTVLDTPGADKYLFGSVDGSVGKVLKSPVPGGPQGFERPAIDDAGHLTYVSSPGPNNVWLDDQVIVAPGDPLASVPGHEFSDGAFVPGLTPNGQPIVKGNVALPGGSFPKDIGFFFGLNHELVFKNGSAFPGMPGPIEMTT